MMATKEEVVKLARELPGTDEDRETIVKLAMILLQHPPDYVEAVVMELHSAAQDGPKNSQTR